jgi:hypothetical protein
MQIVLCNKGILPGGKALVFVCMGQLQVELPAALHASAAYSSLSPCCKCFSASIAGDATQVLRSLRQATYTEQRLQQLLAVTHPRYVTGKQPNERA